MKQHHLAEAGLTLDDLAHMSANRICDQIIEAGGPLFEKADVSALRKELGVEAEVSGQLYEYSAADIAQWAEDWLPEELGGRGWPATVIQRRRRLPMSARRVQQLVRRELAGQFPELGGGGVAERSGVDVMAELIRLGHNPQPLAAKGGLMAAPRDEAEAALQAEYRALPRPRGGWRQALLLAQAVAAEPDIQPGRAALALDRKRLRQPMVVQVSGYELKRLARLGAKVVPRRSFGEPDMTRVRLRAADGRLELTASNLVVSAIAGAPCEVKTEGAALVPARLLAQVAARFDDGAVVDIGPVKNRLRIQSGGLSFALTCDSEKHFPRLQPTEGLDLAELAPRSLHRVASEVAYAASASEDHINLKGVWLVPEGGGSRWVATDGHRLATLRSEDPAPSRSPVLLPGGVFSLLRPSERCALGVTRARVEVETDEVYWLLQRLSVTCPSWEGVLEAPEDPVQLTASRAELLRAARSVMVATDRGFPLVTLDVSPGRVAIRTENYATGEACAEVEVKTTGAPELRVAVNGRYLVEALGAMSAGQVRLSATDERSAVHLEGVGQPGRHTLLPCRL